VRKRIALAAAATLATAGAVSGAAAYSASTKTVLLSVDGNLTEVDTRGDTVAAVLEEEDVEIGRHDAVAPSLSAPVDDGSRIAVRFGRPLDLTVDGAQDTYWVTATRVSAALEQIGRRFVDADLSTSRSAPIGREGLDLTVRTEKQVTVVDRGERSKEVTTALTVGGALRDLGVKVDHNDQVRPRVAAPIDDCVDLEVVGIRARTRKVKQEIPNQTVVRYDDDMLEGHEKVRQAGRDGVRLSTYEVLLANGEPRDRDKVKSTVLTAPAPRVEVHGTKEPPSPQRADDTGGGLSSAPCATGSSVEEGLTSNAIAVHRAVCAEFPEISSYGGLYPGDDGEHGVGRALDIMVSDSATGDAIAEFVRANAGALGVSEVIWSQHIWTVQRSSEGWRWMEDMGSATANHYDHVHVTVY
jgi:resuscitation-promoting factor RpfB